MITLPVRDWNFSSLVLSSGEGDGDGFGTWAAAGIARKKIQTRDAGSRILNFLILSGAMRLMSAPVSGGRAQELTLQNSRVLYYQT
jgi:hypothetical protein